QAEDGIRDFHVTGVQTCALPISALGAVAFAFSSYNFIYIEAGHANKTYAIAFMAPILAGILLAFRGRHLLGSVVLAFSLALEIRVNHIQVTYYLFLAALALVGVELYHDVREKRVRDVSIATG